MLASGQHSRHQIQLLRREKLICLRVTFFFKGLSTIDSKCGKGIGNLRYENGIFPYHSVMNEHKPSKLFNQ